MQMELRVRHADLEDALRTYLERRLLFALGRFADRIGRIIVRVHDINGPRGGVDKQCQFTVALVRHGSVHLAETDANVYQAVDRAAHRLSICVQRRLKRSYDVFFRR